MVPATTTIAMQPHLSATSPPEHLNEAEALIWREVAARLPPSTKSIETVARYCQMLHLYRQAQALAAQGPIGTDFSANPGYAQVAKLSGSLLQLEKTLRLV